MTVAEVKKHISGFDYLLQRLEIQSGVGRERLASAAWFAPGSEEALRVELERISRLKAFIEGGADYAGAAGSALDAALDADGAAHAAPLRTAGGAGAATLEKLRLKFSQIWDIRNTFKLLTASETLDDIRFFEIKRFALLSGEISILLDELIKACAFHPAPARVPPLDPVVAVLDPRGEKIATFHIYNEYDERLAQLRKQLETRRLEAGAGSVSAAPADGSAAPASNSAAPADAAAKNPTTAGAAARVPAASIELEITELQARCEDLERDIREKLSASLRPFVSDLTEAIDTIAYWDLLIAKAFLAQKYTLTAPCIRPGGIAGTHSPALRYKGLFNPMVKEILENSGHRYQCVDIELYAAPCLLTGANMSGKTVLLKTLALSQTLLQFGFPVPALSAETVLADDVEILVRDEQNEERGLSSFGAEIQGLDRVFKRIKNGEKLLLLADEPARTTNPGEGKALVQAILDALQPFACISLLSTHYGPIDNPVRRLRVKGFCENRAEGGAFGLERIQSCMDYAVVEEKYGEEPPAEALRIASLLGFDQDILNKAKDYLGKEKV